MYDSRMSEVPTASRERRYFQWVEGLEQGEKQIALQRCQERLELAMFVKEQFGDPSNRFAADAVALFMRVSPQQAQNRIATATAFADCPPVVAKVADGTWLIEHADAVLEGLACAALSEEQRAAALDLVLAKKTARTPWELRRATRAAVAVLFPDLLLAQADKAAQDRDVQLWPGRLGQATLSASGSPEQVEAMMAALDAQTWPPAPDDTRTAAQRRFDALYDLVTGAADPSQWQVHLLVGLGTLLGDDELAASTDRGTLLSARTARECAARGTLRRVIVDDETGQLVAVDARSHRPDLFGVEVTEADATQVDATQVGWWSAEALDRALAEIASAAPPDEPSGTAAYQVPRRLKRHLAMRDRTCRFPGCPRRAALCDADHLVPWPRGSTDVANLASECEHHHQAKHHHFTVRALPDGTLRWIAPSGHHYDSPVPSVLETSVYAALLDRPPL